MARVTSLIDFGSKEARDGAMATGMTDGMEQSDRRLDRLLGGTDRPFVSARSQRMLDHHSVLMASSGLTAAALRAGR